MSFSAWCAANMLIFNSFKTKFLPIKLSHSNHIPDLHFEDNLITPSKSINILGLNISSNFSWKPHLSTIAKAASQKLGILFRLRSYFTPAQLLQIWKGLIRPCLEYCSHVWGGSSSTRLLDRVESKAYRLIGSPTLTSSIPSLSLRRDVASLSLFYRYYFGRCSDELTTCVPPPKVWRRGTRLAASSHAYCVDVGNQRIDRYTTSFFPSTSNLWNSLPPNVFPASYNLSSFKCRAFRHLRSMD